MTSPPASSDREYLSLLALLYQTADALKGKKAADSRLPDCEQLAAKLFVHCSTIYLLSKGTRVPVPEVGYTDFVDHSSITVIARAALEAYLTLFEVFVEPKTDDEREYRHACWLLSGFVLRENWKLSDHRLEERLAESRRQIKEMRERIKGTHAYKGLTSKQQRSVLCGKQQRGEMKLRLRRAGFGERFWRKVYAYQSGHVHADGLSATQILSASTTQDQDMLVEPSRLVAMVAMSKMILDYVSMFPEARDVAKANVATYTLAQVLSGAASALR